MMTKQSTTSCCSWRDFENDFRYALDHDPTDEEMEQADKNWRLASTGWEAAQIAMGPVEPEYELEHIAGNHYKIVGEIKSNSSESS